MSLLATSPASHIRDAEYRIMGADEEGTVTA